MLWSNAWSSLWKQEFLSARYAVRVYGAGFDKSWLCCEKYRSVGYFHHCSVSADGRRLSLVCPLRMQDSIDCLLPLFDILSARNDPSLTVSLSRTHLKWHRGEDSAPYAEILHERTEQIMTISADVSTAVAATKRKRKQTDEKTAPRPKLPDNELRDAKRAARSKARRLLMKLSRAKPSDNGDVEADVNDNDSDSDESCVSNLSEELAKYIESDVESAGDMEGVEGEPGAAKPGKPAALVKVNAPPPLPPALEDPATPTLHGSWVRNIQEGCQLYNNRMLVNEADINSNLSLCEVPAVDDDDETAVCFYCWSRVPAQKGWAHSVGLTRAREVKCAIANSKNNPLINLAERFAAGDAVLVLADTGVSMHQQRNMRQTMPAPVMSLQRRWCCGAGRSFAQDDVCCHCDKRGHGGLAGILRTCPLCYLTIHPVCAQRLATSVDMTSLFSGAMPSLNSGALPDAWSLCAMCAVTVGHGVVLRCD